MDYKKKQVYYAINAVCGCHQPRYQPNISTANKPTVSNIRHNKSYHIACRSPLANANKAIPKETKIANRKIKITTNTKPTPNYIFPYYRTIALL